MGYKGESPAKKMARIQYWISLRETMGLNHFQKSKHMVLASRECGDVSALLGLGVQASNIIAVDIDPLAIDAVKSRFPGVKAIHGDVVTVARTMNRKLSSVFLDFCGYAGPKAINTVGRVVSHGLANDGFLGCGFMKGREKGTARGLVQESQNEVLQIMEIFKQMPRHELLQAAHDQAAVDNKFARQMSTMTDDEIVQEYMNMSQKSDDFNASMRDWFLSHSLAKELYSIRFMTRPLRSFHYISKTKDNKGIPMQLLLCQLSRAPIGSSMDSFSRKSSVQFDMPNADILDDTDDTDIEGMFGLFSDIVVVSEIDRLRLLFNLTEDQLSHINPTVSVVAKVATTLNASPSND
jgi:hypothetical protein